MKSVMILAALCAALCISVPAAQAKGPSDKDIFCTFFPYTAKCAPAAPAAAKPAPKLAAAPAKPAKAAPVKVAAAKPAPVGIKTLACVKAAAGAGHLYSCKWK